VHDPLDIRERAATQLVDAKLLNEGVVEGGGRGAGDLGLGFELELRLNVEVLLHVLEESGKSLAFVHVSSALDSDGVHFGVVEKSGVLVSPAIVLEVVGFDSLGGVVVDELGVGLAVDGFLLGLG